MSQEKEKLDGCPSAVCHEKKMTRGVFFTSLFTVAVLLGSAVTWAYRDHEGRLRSLETRTAKIEECSLHLVKSIDGLQDQVDRGQEKILQGINQILISKGIPTISEEEHDDPNSRFIKF